MNIFKIIKKKKSKSLLCSFCKKEDETGLHLLLLEPELSLQSFKTISYGGYSASMPIFLGY